MIPKPKCPSRYKKQDLLALFNIPDERLKSLQNRVVNDIFTFQDAVNNAAEWHLEAKTRADMQEPPKWERFTNEIVAFSPDLKNYEDHWPLYSFISMWKQGIRSSEKRLIRNRHSVTPPLRDVSHQEYRPMFIGKPLPRRIRFKKNRGAHGLLSADSALLACNSQKDSSYISVATASRRATNWAGSHLVMADNEMILSRRQRSPSLVIAETSSSQSGNSSLDDAGETDISFTACLSYRCVPYTFTANKLGLDAIFHHNKLVIDSLSSLGICSDKQLNTLMDLRMWSFGPDRFFDSIPTSELSLLYRAYILRQLKIKQGLIPRPSLEIEARLTSDKSKSSPIWKIIGPDNGIRCLQFIKFSSLPLTGSTYQEAVDEQAGRLGSRSLSDLKGKISSAFPFLNEYEEAWPLILHFKWKKDQLRIENPMSLNETPYQVPRSGCPIHPPAPEWDYVPTKLQTLLWLFSMEELTPLFLMAPVRTNEDFDLLRGLDEEDRIFVFEQLKLPHLKRFQRWMLAFLLKNIDFLD
ncbi:hypothetical protein C0995_009277 [Termitomyces sp. Mi166|nr:hypothetical protein C0995_009277 [Termitomyces sp. Mi166\